MNFQESISKNSPIFVSMNDYNNCLSKNICHQLPSYRQICFLRMTNFANLLKETSALMKRRKKEYLRIMTHCKKLLA